MANDKELIVKKTIYAGTKSIHFKDGTKVHFHFQARLCDDEKTILDDSRKLGEGKPLDLILGKKFKLEVWEVILQKMALNEVAQFTVDKSLVGQYPFVSKTLRDLQVPKEERKRSHCCAMTLQNEGIGYDDLNELMKNPRNLEFIMGMIKLFCQVMYAYFVVSSYLNLYCEIVNVEQPDNYEKETWQMGETEKIELIPKLKEQGNEAFRNKEYSKAADTYAKAIGLLEQLMLREKPHDIEWNEFDKQKVPILLNFAQCKLQEGDYYPVIEHCTTALKSDPENVKGYFRRAKAHMAVWNVVEARKDFEQVARLDKSLESVVKKELAYLDGQMKEKDEIDKEKLKKMFV